MGRASLSSALAFLSQIDVNFTNLGKIVEELVEHGFDVNTAKTATGLALRNGSEMKMLKSAASLSDVLKAVYNSSPDVDMAQVYDAASHQGIDPDEAIKSIDPSNPSIEVDSPDDDQGIYHGDESDEEPNFNNLSDEALRQAEEVIQINPGINGPELAQTLERSGADPQEIRTIVKYLFKESKVVVSDTDISALDAAAIFQHVKADPEVIFSSLEQLGYTPEDIQHAFSTLHIKTDSEEEESQIGAPPGAEDDVNSPSDPSMGIDDTFGGGGGTGTDETGMAVGDPGMEDMSSMDLNNVEQDPATETEVRPGETDWDDVAAGYASATQDPQELASILRGLGAPDSTAREVAFRMNTQDDTIRPGASVVYKNQPFKVAAMSTSLYGDVVVLENGPSVLMDDENLHLDTTKVASVEEKSLNEVLDKVSSFYNEEYLYQEDSLNAMASKAEDLVGRLASYDAKTQGESLVVAEKVRELNYAIKTFKEASEKVSEENRAYQDSLPKYQAAAFVVKGNETGPGGGDAISLVAQDLEKERDSIDWNSVVTVEAANVVEENLGLISSTGDMRKAASRYIQARTSHLESENKDKVVNAFLANVEKARRMAVKELTQVKEARVENKETHDYDEGVFI